MQDTSDLGALADPSAFHHDLKLPHDPAPLVPALERMMLIRAAEERIGDKVAEGVVRCPAHLAIGQEAPAVGVALHLRPTDRAFGAHRSHAHYLAATGDVRSLFAEALGRETGASRGMGGSMHLIAMRHGFFGSVPIVGATIPIAVGAALAAKKDAKGDIAISYFGDGATEEGVFHESLNLAAVLKAPVLFLCENNLFSSHLHIDLRQPKNSLCRFARAHDIPSECIDGNDIVTVADTCGRAVADMRRGGGPFFLECVTYRWRGHVGPREDEDVGVKRKDDLEIWKGRDPIARLARALQATGALTPDDLSAMAMRVRTTVEAAWTDAERDPYPALPELTLRTWTPRTS